MPWLKLLPCRDKAGIASLLYRHSIYKGYYHSQKLKLTSSQSFGIILDQTLTVVLQPDSVMGKQLHSTDGQLQPSWSMKDLFNRNLLGKCFVSKSSRVFFEIEKDIFDKVDRSGNEASWANELFVLSPAPDRVLKEINNMNGQSSSLYEYDVSNYEDAHLDVGVTWKLPLIWSCTPAPYHANRFLMGSGNERGSISLSFISTNMHKQLFDNSNDCSIKAVVFQVVPCMQSATLSLDFDKGFLHIDEYPPDANQGFDIPSALVTFPEFNSSRNYLETDSLFLSPLLQTFKEDGVVKSYTEVLLVPLTTPDFSMPYSVITFTCTVLALYFGSLLNALRRRTGEEERELKKAAAKPGLIPLLIGKLRGQKVEPPPPGSSIDSQAKGAEG
ncbi:hypothetical protein GUJ93_ZPchr0011g28859 [Zizania palustris]|uniref:GPI transamidase component PIG-T n=1 Tax=Zizania palustris TaxID=103762 RepID=A0A8J5WJ57_ZIZPA|nr:hypothetical protein GUJ93_ZPchr0011g28859 [Zizania palustris]